MKPFAPRQYYADSSIAPRPPSFWCASFHSSLSYSSVYLFRGKRLIHYSDFKFIKLNPDDDVEIRLVLAAVFRSNDLFHHKEIERGMAPLGHSSSQALKFFVSLGGFLRHNSSGYTVPT